MCVYECVHMYVSLLCNTKESSSNQCTIVVSIPKTPQPPSNEILVIYKRENKGERNYIVLLKR